MEENLITFARRAGRSPWVVRLSLRAPNVCLKVSLGLGRSALLCEHPSGASGSVHLRVLRLREHRGRGTPGVACGVRRRCVLKPASTSDGRPSEASPQRTSSSALAFRAPWVKGSPRTGPVDLALYNGHECSDFASTCDAVPLDSAPARVLWHTRGWWRSALLYEHPSNASRNVHSPALRLR